jgi:hypothetical protein
MGRFSSSAAMAGERYGNVDVVSDVWLWLQDVSGEKLRRRLAPSRLSFSSFSSALPQLESASGNSRSGFVTIGDYQCSGSELPRRGVAKMELVASQVSRAGKRAVHVDAHGRTALGGGRKAGCDAGKGAFEPTAGSLAEGTASAPAGTISAAAGMGGNERNRVKC